jgi:hypothetical protein
MYKDTGAEIKEWIENEIQAKCEIVVISRRWEPCLKEVGPEEIYDNAQFGVTLLEPLPEWNRTTIPSPGIRITPIREKTERREYSSKRGGSWRSDISEMH